MKAAVGCRKHLNQLRISVFWLVFLRVNFGGLWCHIGTHFQSIMPNRQYIDHHTSHRRRAHFATSSALQETCAILLSYSTELPRVWSLCKHWIEGSLSTCSAQNHTGLLYLVIRMRKALCWTRRYWSCLQENIVAKELMRSTITVEMSHIFHKITWKWPWPPCCQQSIHSTTRVEVCLGEFTSSSHLYSKHQVWCTKTALSKFDIPLWKDAGNPVYSIYCLQQPGEGLLQKGFY